MGTTKKQIIIIAIITMILIATVVWNVIDILSGLNTLRITALVISTISLGFNLGVLVNFIFKYKLEKFENDFTDFTDFTMIDKK